MPDSLAIDQLRSWIGRQERKVDIITPGLLERFQATLEGYTELAAQPPPGIHWCLGQAAVSRDHLGADGHPSKGGFLPPVPLPRRMWASGRLHFHSPPQIGLDIERTSTITDVVFKQGSSGPLVFVHLDHVHRQPSAQGETTLIEEQQVIVYRQPSTLPTPQPADPPMQRVRSLTILPDSLLLFRYSALTFNGHRIHYDRDYACREEGYPGLVVQGPLMATLLMNLAQARRPRQILRDFEFRSLAPAFADQPLQLASDDAAGESLAITNRQGAVIMRASAGFTSAPAD